MKVSRRFTTQGQDVFQTVKWAERSTKIMNQDGSVVFEMNDARVPEQWSQLATDIMVSKYFRKAGVPMADDQGQPITDANGEPVTGPEQSAGQVIHRLAGCWRHWGQEHGYFETDEDGQAFYDELCHMMLNQMAAPNSPQWFNTGLNWAYGITGPAQGHWITDSGTGETQPADDAYTHPQPHACFIQSIDDDLVGPGGIMDLWIREARLFKYGSGTGTNFSSIRGENEPLSGGGKSSGLMSFLKIGDRAAGAIKSGGTTRRAAKMACLDLDHPDIVGFINWKVREEIKVAAMVEGFKRISREKASPSDPESIGETAERLGLQLDYDFNGEAYQTVSGQNANNSVRIPNEFFQALDENTPWDLRRRTDDETAESLPARKLWDHLCYAAWRCADPGVQFDSTINQWHTCPESGRINASNPCSEYMFLDNTACNLASLNLLKFFDAEAGTFDIEGFEHAVRIWTMVLEISVLMAAFPSKEIARLSYEYRTLGLGFANIGAMLMQAGIPYDSEQARAITGAVSAVLTGRSYATSAELAGELGPFAGYHRNKEHMLRVIANHRRAAYGVARNRDQADDDQLEWYEGLDIPPVPINGDVLEGESPLANSVDLLAAARGAWDDALGTGREFGFRNAQVSVIAPTGTIGLLMDCDTTGVEPDFSIVKFKKLAGGGSFKIVNQSIRPALRSLGYNDDQIRDMLIYVMGTLHLDVPMPGDEGHTFTQILRAKGLTDEDLRAVIDSLPTVFGLDQAFNTGVLGEKIVAKLGLTEQAEAGPFNLLTTFGLPAEQVAQLNAVVCGMQTLEGAPHIEDEHLPVFDCANACGLIGTRYIAARGHIRMMAAAQPFISGAISKTINLPNSAKTEDIAEAYRLSWELGLKANALYRDGCKLSQPLNTTADADAGVEDDDNIAAGQDAVAGDVAEVAQRIGEGGERIRTIEKVVERIVERPLRQRLPDTRRSITHKFNVAAHEGYITVGLYEDGQPGELFITMAKEGSTIGGLMDSLGTAISISLQYGVPIESLVNKFTHQRFEPAGMTRNLDIPIAKSLVDYIFRWMGMEFIAGYRAANIPQRPGQDPEADGGADAISPVSAKTARKVATGKKGKNKPDSGKGKDKGNGDSQLASRFTTSDTAPRIATPAGRSLTGETGGGAMTAGAALAAANASMQADAPACDACGTITVRSGTCYKCLNCGASMGCS